MAVIALCSGGASAYPGLENILKNCGKQHLPQEEKHPPQTPWTAEADLLLHQRQAAIGAYNSELADSLTKQLSRQRRKDKK